MFSQTICLAVCANKLKKGLYLLVRISCLAINLKNHKLLTFSLRNYNEKENGKTKACQMHTNCKEEINLLTPFLKAIKR